MGRNHRGVGVPLCQKGDQGGFDWNHVCYAAIIPLVSVNLLRRIQIHWLWHLYCHPSIIETSFGFVNLFIINDQYHFDNGLHRFDGGLHLLDGGLHRFDDGLHCFDDGLRHFDDGLRHFDDAFRRFDDAFRRFDDDLHRFDDDLHRFDDGLLPRKQPSKYITATT
jgi:hypothetical protein